MEWINLLRSSPALYVPSGAILLVSQTANAFRQSISQSMRKASSGDSTVSSQEENKSMELGQRNSVAFVHEMVHHIQLLYSSTLYLNELAKLVSATQILKLGSVASVKANVREFVRLTQFEKRRMRGISIMDLVEGGAVLDGFKGAFKTDLSDFIRYRDINFPGKGNSIYRRTFDVMSFVCGQDIAYDLLPFVTYLALQGDIPGWSFEHLIRDKRIQTGTWAGKEASYILDELSFGNPAQKYREIDTLHPLQRHPVFYPIMREIGKILTDKELNEIFARPSLIDKFEHQNSIMEMFYPPLVAGSFPRGGGLGFQLWGIAKTNGELPKLMIHLAAIVGAAESLLFPSETYMPCKESLCPHYATKMCIRYFAPSKSYTECGFQEIVKELMGSDLSTIKTEFGKMISSEVLKKLKTFSSDTEVFLKLPFLNDPGPSYAEKFDDVFDLDPVDNDAALMIPCDCGEIFVMRVSNRKIIRGFVYKCQKCGKTHDISIDTVSTHWVGERKEEDLF